MVITKDQTFQEYLAEAAPDFYGFWWKVIQARKAKDDARWTKEEVKSVYFWMKQLVAVVVAIMCPFTGIRGLGGFAFFVSLSVLAGTVVRGRLHIPDDVLEPAEAFTEGLPAGLTTFLPMWIIFNTIISGSPSTVASALVH